jgi:hypothetical protein
MTSADAKTEPDLFHEDARGPLKLDRQSPDPRRACPCEAPVADAGQPIHELGEPRDRFELPRCCSTGHSLGGALAALAAKYAVSKGVTPCAVLSGCRAWAAIVFASSIQLRSAPTPIGSFTGTISSRGCPCRLWGSIMPAACFNARPKPNSTRRRLSVIGSDEPRFPSVIDSFADHVGSILSGHVLGRPSPMGGVLGEAFRVLP